MPEDEVEYRRDGPVAYLTLNRPERGNAITYRMIAALRRRVAEIGDTDGVRVAVLTGAGRFFCVGGDLGTDAFAPERAGIPVERDVSAQAERSQLTVELRGARYATIAMLNGGCAGAGLALALACDLRFAVDTAELRTAYLPTGVSGDYGIGWLLQHLVGGARARELMLLSAKVSAERAEQLGLLSGVFGADELGPAVHDIAQRLAACPPGALAAVKANQLLAESQPLHRYLADEAVRQVRTARERLASQPHGAR